MYGLMITKLGNDILEKEAELKLPQLCVYPELTDSEGEYIDIPILEDSPEEVQNILDTQFKEFTDAGAKYVIVRIEEWEQYGDD